MASLLPCTTRLPQAPQGAVVLATAPLPSHNPSPGQCYLDHAGAALYSEEQVRQALGELTKTLLGNPHSRHTPSDTATQTLEAVRHR